MTMSLDCHPLVILIGFPSPYTSFKSNDKTQPDVEAKEIFAPTSIVSIYRLSIKVRIFDKSQQFLHI